MLVSFGVTLLVIGAVAAKVALPPREGCHRARFSDRPGAGVLAIEQFQRDCCGVPGAECHAVRRPRVRPADAPAIGTADVATDLQAAHRLRALLAGPSRLTCAQMRQQPEQPGAIRPTRAATAAGIVAEALIDSAFVVVTDATKVGTLS